MVIKKIPKIISPRSRVRLIRADRRTPSWEKANGRQFRIGYYSRKDGLDCIWLVNENGTYEQTTDRAFLLKYFDVEQLSQEKNLYGRGKRRLRKIHVPTRLERLTAASSIEAYEGAKEILQKDDPKVVRPVINVLLHGQRALNRAAAAYALHLPRGNAAVLALEKTVANKREHPKVRGQAAESLAFNGRSFGLESDDAHLQDAEIGDLSPTTVTGSELQS